MRGPAHALTLLAGVVVLSACNAFGAPPWVSTRPDPGARSASARDSTARPVRSVEELEETGPTYVVYDRGPVLRQSDRLTDLLEKHLLPIIEDRDLPLRTFTLFWILVRADGTVADVELHTPSTVEAFDRAAAEVARRLKYEPAYRRGRPLPVWILDRVHLRMP